MGNAQFKDAERTCGKFPAPMVDIRRIGSLRKMEDITEGPPPPLDKEETTTTTGTTSTTNGGNHDTNNSNKSTTNITTTNQTKGGVLGALKSTLRGILDPPEPPRLPPKRHAPKRRLYGCETTDEHYDYIRDICAQVATLQGREGLEAMGFEFRLVHHAEHCTCRPVGGSGDDETLDAGEGGILLMNDVDDELTDSDDDGYTSDLSRDKVDDTKEDSAGDDFGQFEEDPSLDEIDEHDDTTNFGEPMLVPIGSSLKAHDAKWSFVGELPPLPRNNNNNSAGVSSSPYGSKAVSRSTSVVSLFSLATHNTTTDFSSVGGGSSRRRDTAATTSGRFPLSSIASQQTNHLFMEQDSCALRLCHIPSGGTLVTPENHQTYVADGDMYDQLSRLCMEYAQETMMREGNLEWMTICQNRQFGAMVSKSFLERIQTKTAAATTDNHNSSSNSSSSSSSTKKRKILVVVTGKGEVTAGIFSRRHLLVTSMEAATALPFIRGAKERDMDIVMLDPNALGYRLGMDVVETSLERLFLDRLNQGEEEDIYILAHSMAGAQIVRFFMNNSSSYSRPPTPPSSNGSNEKSNPNMTDREAQKASLLKRIQALAFTDSNHNINWTKKYPHLTEVLTGRPSLYIKSHKVHEKAKKLGEAHHDCQFWRHRFGDIKTLWAGTHEHALTNYTGRVPIWEHFDSFLNEPEEGSR